ncbi:MAG: hypothetical protein ACP6IP_02800 [Candidatus Njordarchaeia archaeon]
MSKTKGLLLGLGSIIAYGLLLKTATGFARVSVKVSLPNYDWFILVLVSLLIGIFAFFQESDKKIARGLGGFFKYMMLATYTYALLTMSSKIEILSTSRIIVVIDWGLWLYVFLLPTILNALIFLIKPFAEED